MQYRKLGQTGVNVSVLCLGAMTFGEADEKSMMHKASSDESTSHAILDRALDLGINFIDTADVYGQDGLSERVLGSWFSQSGKRNHVVLATKFRFTMGDSTNKSGASRYRIVRCVEDSLRRLQTDRIDLYQIHMQDVETPEEEIARALDDLVRAGKVVYLGASNYAAYRLMESLWIADKRGYARFVSLQAQYSLLVRDLEREHVPLCEKFGLGLLPWSPLAGGFLSGKYDRGENPAEGRFSAPRQSGWLQSLDTDKNWTILGTLREVAAELDVSPSQAALAWCIAQPTVSSVIFGARSISQLEENAQALEVQLSPAALKRLDEISRLDLGYPYSFMKRAQGRW